MKSPPLPDITAAAILDVLEVGCQCCACDVVCVSMWFGVFSYVLNTCAMVLVYLAVCVLFSFFIICLQCLCIVCMCLVNLIFLCAIYAVVCV